MNRLSPKTSGRPGFVSFVQRPRAMRERRIQSLGFTVDLSWKIAR